MSIEHDDAPAPADAGHTDWADRIRTGLVGRNVLHGRWTFQIVEEYDATYWSEFRATVAAVEGALVGGGRRTAGRRHHGQRPA